jgi:luciferase-like monooxygenase
VSAQLQPDTPGFALGLNSFGEVATTGPDRRVMSDAETIRLLIEEARLAESVGLDIFSVGEHYRAGHTDLATPVLLAAVARETERIGLGTAVTVISTNDPVRCIPGCAKAASPPGSASAVAPARSPARAGTGFP